MSMRLLLFLAITSISSPCLANWTVRSEQTIAQARNNAALARRQSFVPVYAKIYALNGRLVLDEIWERGGKNVGWDVRVQLTDAEFRAHDARLRGEGYTCYCHSSCRLNGATFHAGVWRRGQLGPARAIRIAEDREAHRRSASSLSNLGYVPVYVKGSAVGSAIRLDQVWEKRRAKWDMRSFLDAKQLALHDKQMKDLGFRREWISTYRVNRTFLNAAIWYR